MHLLQPFLLPFQLPLQSFYLLLLFPLPVVPLHAAGASAFVGRKTDGLIKLVNLCLQGGDLGLLRLNLGLPAFG